MTDSGIVQKVINKKIHMKTEIKFPLHPKDFEHDSWKVINFLKSHLRAFLLRTSNASNFRFVWHI